MRRFIYIALLILPLLAGQVCLAASPESNTSIGSIVAATVSNPKMGLTILIEFLLGVALGYVGVKALKYLLAFIGILLLGSFLSAWSLGGNLGDLAGTLGVELRELLPVMKQFAIAIGVTIVGPSALGILFGVILAMVKQ